MPPTRSILVFLAVAAVAAAAGCSGASPDDSAASPEPTESAAPGPGEPGFHDDFAMGDTDYDIYVPKAYDPDAVMPAVLVLHGMPSGGDEARRQSQMDILAEEQGLLAVYPSNPDSRWTADVTDEVDLGYIRDVISDLVDTWNADPARIYVSGVSNGGDMALTVGAALGDQVAAVAAVVPAGTGEVEKSVAAVDSPIPLIAFIGGDDARRDAGMDLLATWRKRIGCGDAESQSDDAMVTDSYSCDKDTEMVVHEVLEAGHEWIGEPDSRDPIWASEAMWEFFAAHPKR